MDGFVIKSQSFFIILVMVRYQSAKRFEGHQKPLSNYGSQYLHMILSDTLSQHFSLNQSALAFTVLMI